MDSKIDIEKAVEMRNNHATFQEIADKFGVSRQAVQQKLKRYEKRKAKRKV